MKKIFYSLLALVSLLAASCSNDDIEITTYAPKNDLKVNISTTSAYDVFGIDDYKTILAKYDETHVAVMSLVYDKDEKLVASENSYLKTFQQVQQKFALPNGTYTLVTVVTFADKDGETYKPLSWKFVDVNTLSTVRLDKLYNEVMWYNSLAVASKTINVDDANVTTSVAPTPVGSLLDIYYENFDKSPYVWFGYEMKQSATGFMLDPSLSGIDRYYYNKYNDRNNWTGVYGSYESSGLTEGNGTRFVLEEGRLNYCFGLTDKINSDNSVNFTAYPTRNEYYTFRSGETNYAYCYYVGGNNVCETYMGDGSDLAEWYESVTNGGNNNNENEFKFVEPTTDWGGSVRSVQSYMGGYEMILGASGAAEYLYDGVYALGYNGNYSEEMIAYYFSSQTTGLYEATLFYDASKVTESQLTKALGEKYQYYGVESGMHVYLNSEFTTGIALYSDDENTTWYVNYMSLLDNAGDIKALKRAVSEKRAVNLPKRRMKKPSFKSSSLLSK